jgi:hypothetical protein
MSKKLTKEQFVDISTNIHKNKYDYSRVEYIDSKTKVRIICPIHGEFMQKPYDHLDGHGCPICRYTRPFVMKEGFVNDMPYLSTHERVYICWHSMVVRCNSSKVHNRQPTYLGCYICKDWHYLSKFKEWFDEHYVEGWCLDKDILVKGNREYSPQTCCFIPQEINNLLTTRKKSRNNLPIGVTYRKSSKKYVAQIHKTSTMCSLGYFNTPEEAFEAYKVAKEAWIAEKANKWKDQLDSKVYDALCNYKVEIDD